MHPQLKRLSNNKLMPNQHTTTKVRTDIKLAVGITVGMIAAFLVGMGFVGVMNTLSQDQQNQSDGLLCFDIISSFNDQNVESTFKQLESNSCKKYTSKITGVFNVMDIDDFNTMGNEEKYYLITENGSDYQLNFINLNFNQFFANKPIYVSVDGYLTGNNLIVDFEGKDNDNTNFNIDATGGVSYMDPILGDQKTAVLLLDYTHIQMPEFTIADAQIIFNDVSDYYTENSLEKMDFTGVIDPAANADINGRYLLPLTSCGTSNWGQILNEAMLAADNDYDFTQYDRIIFMSPPGCGAFSPHRGPRDYNTPDGPANFTIVMDDNYDNQLKSASTISHELGHNFGLSHASSFPCNIHTTPLQACFIQEYQDDLDIMGQGLLRHNNAKYKELLGWLSDWDVITGIGNTVTINATPGSIYTFELEPIETNTEGIKVIKVPRAGINYNYQDYLYIEYREDIGYDSDDINQMNYNLPNAYNGALLHIDYGTDIISSRSLIFDPNGIPTGYWTTPAVLEGESFIDPETQVKISVLNVTRDLVSPENSKITVEISFPPDCIDGTPSGQCQQNGTYYCDNGILVQDCRICGSCTGDMTCDFSSGSCFCNVDCNKFPEKLCCPKLQTD